VRKEVSRRININQKLKNQNHQYIPPPPFSELECHKPDPLSSGQEEGIGRPDSIIRISRRLVEEVGRAWPAACAAIPVLLGKNPAGEAGKTLAAS
jgi:hypothetical protein